MLPCRRFFIPLQKMNLMSDTKTSTTARTIEVAVHMLTWAYIFLSPLFFHRTDETFDWHRFLEGCSFPTVTCVAFYVNYFVLIPRYVFSRQRLRTFVVANVVMCIVLLSLLEVQMHFAWLTWGAKHAAGDAQRHFPPKIFFIIRGFITFVFVICASVALRLNLRWRQSEQARAEAELRRSEAELKNLKSQINPHFLLNTLNNIYALTAFDTQKAQDAIQKLSRLLRYMLYENQSDTVPLGKEADFIRSYVALMRLRLSDDVQVTLDIDAADPEVMVAPLIFISLVENAFKHGVSPTMPSFISIALHADRSHVTFECINSNFPKTAADKAPGGIGLRQVRSRLEWAYAGRYSWTQGVSGDGRTYSSRIDIRLNNG